jgi:hypothetical protein
LATSEITNIKTFVFSQRLKLTFFNDINLILRYIVDRPLDQPLLPSLILFISPLIKIGYLGPQQQCLLLMYHHDIAYPIDYPLSWEEEELGLALPYVLQPILRLPLFIHRVIYDAVLVAGEYYYFIFINKFLMGIEYMNVFNRFINKPLLSSFSLVSVEIFEILECSQVEGGLVV